MEKKKVLVVEDEGIIANDIVGIVKNKGYDVEHVSSGDEAVKKANSVDLVIMDLKIRGMDGVKAGRRINELYGIPVIYITGLAYNDPLVKEVKEVSDCVLLNKPFEDYKLLDCVKEAIGEFNKKKKLKNKKLYKGLVNPKANSVVP